LIHQLNKANFVRREPTDLRTHVYLFDRADAEVRVAWSAVSPARLRLEADEALTVLDIMRRQILFVQAGRLTDLVIDDNTVYILGVVRRIADAPRDEILAGSLEDYSDKQGEDGWYCVHYDGNGGSSGTSPRADTDRDFELLGRRADRWGS
jgi:hypothetical protein